MTDRARLLATVWGGFWLAVEANGKRMAGQPGVLMLGLQPIDDALREALGKAFDAGCLHAVHDVFEVAGRNN